MHTITGQFKVLTDTTVCAVQEDKQWSSSPKRKEYDIIHYLPPSRRTGTSTVVTKQIALCNTTYTDSKKQQHMGRKKNKEETVLY